MKVKENSLKKYLLAVDIGNTSIRAALYKNERRILRIGLPSYNAGGFGHSLTARLKKKKIPFSRISCACICSVAPELNPVIENALKNKLGIPVHFIGRDIAVPIRNLYGNPKQVGPDRLVGAYAGARLYGGAVIVIDLGTAITFDVVSAKNEYLGGLILPGLGLSLKALHRYTALLPEIKIARPKALIGKNTRESMLAGLAFGFGVMIDGIISKIRKSSSPKAKAVLCGGDSGFIRPYSRMVDYIEQDLILIGLRMLANEK